MRYEFEWDPAKDRSNNRKHGVAFRRAATIFRDPNQLSLYDEEHSDEEDRWITMGLDNSGVLVVVVHLFDERSDGVSRIRIISARKATASEERQYAQDQP